MQLELTIGSEYGDDVDVRVRAPSHTPLSAVIRELAAHVPEVERGLWAGPIRLPPRAALDTLGLRTGQVLRAGSAGSRELVATAWLQVVGGPAAGMATALSRGETVIGRGGECDLVLDDPQVSRRHAAISMTQSGISVCDLDSTNGTGLDGEPVTRSGPLEPGAHLRVGDSTLSINLVDEPAATVRNGDDGTLLLNRAPRPLTPACPGLIAVPEAPTTRRRERSQLLAALLPAAAGGAFALLAHQPVFLALAAAGPAAMLMTALAQRRRDARSQRTSGARFEADRRRVEADIAALLVDETRRRRHAACDPVALGRSAVIPSSRVWERRRDDADFLDVRLGLADLPSRLLAQAGSPASPGLPAQPAGTLSSVPLTLHLAAGPIGICGPRPMRLAIARWLVGQLAGLHSPSDLSLEVLSPDRPSWSWTRRLPHRSSPLAATQVQRQELVTRLLTETERRRATLPAGSTGPWRGPWTVVIHDAGLPDAADVSRLLARGPSVGITALCVADQRRQLPSGCTVVASAAGDPGTCLRIEATEHPDGTTCIADQVSLAWAVALSRALMPLRDGGGDRAGALPATCGLLQLHGIGVPSTAQMIERWARGDGAPVAAIGTSSDGRVLIDLARDGPHVLVAGTTGSGKSELLRSLVTGLALRNSPAEVSFILIDYKGGAAFADCARLPHTAGLVTDLDPHLTERALRSLNAELRRREVLLAAAGAVDIDGYRASPQRANEPLDRLVIVVDEFATLADEQPDLLGGLLAVARRGRSLGLHLVLATQRPGGVVSAEVQANLALRIALRVTDPGESAAVVGTAAAAGIDQSRPGRAIMRAGVGRYEFQTARIGLPAALDHDEVRVELLDADGDAIGSNPVEPAAIDDLSLLVDSMRSAADATGLLRVSSPWLPPLPRTLHAGDLRGLMAPAELTAPLWPADRYVTAIGLVDLPDQQRQEPLTVDLQCGGSLLVTGPARSGRSSALTTLARMATQQLRASQLQIYVIDCAGGALAELGALPHCGAALTRLDTEAVARLISRLADEVRRRQRAPMTNTCDPALLLLIDGWEGFVDSADAHEPGILVEAMHALLREASSARLTVAVTGANATANSRVGSSVTRTFTLSGAWPGGAVESAGGNAVQFAVASIDSAESFPESTPTESMPTESMTGAGSAVRTADHGASTAVGRAHGRAAPPADNSADGRRSRPRW